MDITLRGHPCRLLPEKALFLTCLQTLVVADVHVGKSRICREQGIPIPQSICEQDLECITKLCRVQKAQRLIILGDLLHDTPSGELEVIRKWRRGLGNREVILLRGNHDRVDDRFFKSLDICTRNEIEESGLRYVHAEPSYRSDVLTLCGHIHPGIRLKNRSYSSLRLPCFVRDAHRFILPAFGSLTGLFEINQTQCTDIYPVGAGRVWHIPNRAGKLGIELGS